MGATPSCLMRAGGTNVLQLSVPAGVTCEPFDGRVRLDAPHATVNVWLVRDARTVSDGVARAGGQVADEFKEFKADRTTDLTVAGSPAKRLVGSGEEADDGDPGTADVIVFAVGGRVFVACYHGERVDPAGRQEMLAIVQTARRP